MCVDVDVVGSVAYAWMVVVGSVANAWMDGWMDGWMIMSTLTS